MSENNLYRQYIEALGPKCTRSLVLDKHCWQENITQILARAGRKNIRLATKSIRSVELLKDILAHSAQFQGLMTYTLEESLWLRSLGFKDILMGYPTWDIESLEKLAQDPRDITLMVDRMEHLVLLQKMAAAHRSTFQICLDLDLSMDLPGLRFGVYRSHLESLPTLAPLIVFLKQHTSELKLRGLMGYEAQVAGVADKNKPLIAFLKNRSIKKLRARREMIHKELLSHGFKLELVNGGGTGSLESTREENCVTEVTVGSGFYGPKLFDGYQQFNVKPALFFSLPIVRNPKENIYTCLGGGYIASGMMGKDRLPSPYLPQGLKLLPYEGAGEVQTPLQSSTPLTIGEPVFFRHAKAGEICEHFNEIKIYENKVITKVIKTYRGEGQCFL